MIPAFTIISICFLHWFFDFFLQTDEQANGKSKSNQMLIEHVSYYSIGLALMAFVNAKFFEIETLIFWFGANVLLHFFTDWLTSRATSLLWENGRLREFFTTIGFDQFLHYFALFGTLAYLISIA